jgi:hypothetical protein
MALMLKRLKNESVLIFLIYLSAFTLLFFAYRKGIGQFWDWGWPYFREHIANIFWNHSLSWTDFNLGRPLAYASDYWARLLLATTEFLPLQSETIICILLVAIASISSYIAYLISIKKSGFVLSIVIGLITILNPAFLYKLVSGHTDYLISYPIFVGLIYYLQNKLKKDPRSYLFLGLLLAFVGAQIQFFAFALIFILVFFIVKREIFSWKYSLSTIFIALLINLPWLSNFLVGANQVSNFSNQAASVSFEGAMRAKIQNVLLLAFSDATTIKYYFNKPEFVFMSLFSLAIIALIAIYLTKRKSSEKTALSLLWIIFTLLSTGFFHSITFFPFSITNSIFREVGHFAPIAVFFGIMIIAGAKIKNRYYYHFLLLYLIIFAAINSYAIATKLPKLNFEMAREKFQNFTDFTMNDKSQYRILSYPFFGQYSFLGQSKKDVRGRLIENSGTDSILDNAGIESISNYVQPQEFRTSEQYELTVSRDLSLLKERNVKYIYDFSSIWESNFERYSGSEVYDNDLSLIKNDPRFFEKLIAANPGQIVEVENGIYEIVDTQPRIYADGGADVEFEKIDATKYKIRISNLSSAQKLYFLESYHPGWKLLANSYRLTADSLFDSSHQKVLDYANGWTIDSETIRNRLSDDQYLVNSDGSIDLELTLYFQPQFYQNIAIVIAALTVIISSALIVVLCLNKRDSHNAKVRQVIS